MNFADARAKKARQQNAQQPLMPRVIAISVVFKTLSGLSSQEV